MKFTKYNVRGLMILFCSLSIDWNKLNDNVVRRLEFRCFRNFGIDVRKSMPSAISKVELSVLDMQVIISYILKWKIYNFQFPQQMLLKFEEWKYKKKIKFFRFYWRINQLIWVKVGSKVCMNCIVIGWI